MYFFPQIQNGKLLRSACFACQCHTVCQGHWHWVLLSVLSCVSHRDSYRWLASTVGCMLPRELQQAATIVHVTPDLHNTLVCTWFVVFCYSHHHSNHYHQHHHLTASTTVAPWQCASRCWTNLAILLDHPPPQGGPHSSWDWETQGYWLTLRFFHFLFLWSYINFIYNSI